MATEALLEEGLREAAAIDHPLARSRHRAAWLYRLSVIDPPRAFAMLAEIADDASERASFLMTNFRDHLSAEDVSPEAVESIAAQIVPLLLPPDAPNAQPNHYGCECHAGSLGSQRLQLLNALSELAIELANRDRAAGVALLRRLIPELKPLRGAAGDDSQLALGCSLLGEALWAVEAPEGRALLEQAVALSAELPSAEPILSFVANALADHDPAAALELLPRMQDPASRLETRLQLANRLEDPGHLETLFSGAEAEAALLAHQRGPEVLVRLGQALAPMFPERAEPLLSAALTESVSSDPQYRSLQLAGIASALDTASPERALPLYQEAAAMAEQADETAKRVTALTLIANEMAEFHPREAAALFERAMDATAGLEALWEFAHVLELAFRADRSPYLDLAPAQPLLERVLARLTDEDPRIPGVFGLPDAARYMMQLDRERGVEVLRRWLRAAETAADSDGMTQAAIAIYDADPEAGRRALELVRNSLVKRVDCPAMGDFSRAAAAVAPDLVESLAPRIPDRRERADALTLAAIHRYETAPEAALAALRGLERPADRSLALMQLTDRLIGSGERPLPQPLLEELP